MGDLGRTTSARMSPALKEFVVASDKLSQRKKKLERLTLHSVILRLEEERQSSPEWAAYIWGGGVEEIGLERSPGEWPRRQLEQEIRCEQDTEVALSLACPKDTGGPHVSFAAEAPTGRASATHRS